MNKAIILAAGKGTRMKSDLFKVMHKIGNREMVLRVLDTLDALNVDEKIVVLAPQMEKVKALVQPTKTALQPQALGTANAAQAALKDMDTFDGACLILFADHPLFLPSTFANMIDKCNAGTDVVVLGFTPEDPARYGRLVMGQDGLQAIIEYKDASEKQRAIKLCNSGAMCVNGRYLKHLLAEVDNHNAAGEYYLTDIVKIAKSKGLRVDVVLAQDEHEVQGVNSRTELAAAEQVFQQRKRAEAYAAGVTLQDAATTYFSFDTTFENDVVIEPCVYFGAGVHLKKGAHIKAFSRLENVTIGAESNDDEKEKL